MTETSETTNLIVENDPKTNGQYIINGVIIAGATNEDEARQIYQDGQNGND